MKWAVKGVDEYALKLSKLADKNAVQAIANKAIYGAAAIVADSMKNAIKGLSAEPDTENLKRYKKKQKSVLTKTQKEGLAAGLGIAHFKNTNGYINTKIGFNGYNGVITKKFPEGQPNTMIARMVEGGSSTFEAQPFIRKALSNCRSAAIESMNVTIDREIEALK